jgi:hypothetical protein
MDTQASVVYEDDYEYEYTDEDSEEDSNMKDDTVTALKQLAGVKRPAVDSIYVVDNKYPKTTCQSAKGKDKLLPHASIGVAASLLLPATCSQCGEESHAPVPDCAVAAAWLRRGQEDAFAVQVVARYKYMQPMVTGLIREMADTHEISSQEAALKLRQYNWDRYDVRWNDHVRVPIRRSRRNVPAAETPRVGLSCGICLDTIASDTRMTGIGCGHRYCRDCWDTFLSININPSTILVTCPGLRCEEMIPLELIHEIRPQAAEIFYRGMVDSFILAHPQRMRQCPGPDCSRVALRNDGIQLEANHASLNLACCGGCQTRFCFRCGRDPHGTTPCDDTTAGRTKPTARIRKLKICPGCQTTIEKTGGCNHMRCRCGQHFCWICMTPTTASYDHTCQPRAGTQALRRARARTQALRPDSVNMDTLCSAFRGEHAQADQDSAFVKLEEEKKEMEELARTFNSFAVHEHGQQFAATAGEGVCMDERISVFTQEVGFSNGTAGDFIRAANETLVAARRLIKYSYVYDFVREHRTDDERKTATIEKLPSTRRPEAFFVEDHRRLEYVTEELSGLVEYPMTKDDRARLIDLIRTVRKCMKLMVEHSNGS